MSEKQSDERALAQFFFEIGYGACLADVYIANGEKFPFTPTDAGIDRAWVIAQESYDDPEEFDGHKMLADAAPDLLEAHLAWERAEDARNNCSECGNEGPWEHCEPCSDRFGDAIDLRHAAIAKATHQ